MSAILRQTVFASARRTAVVAPASTGRWMSTGSNMHGNDPDVIEKEMKKPKNHSEEGSVHKHAPGWNEVLASVSEANVKADQHDGQIDVEETINMVRKQHPDGSEEVAASAKTTTHPSSSSEAKVPKVNEDVDHIVDPAEKEELKGPLGRVFEHPPNTA